MNGRDSGGEANEICNGTVSIIISAETILRRILLTETGQGTVHASGAGRLSFKECGSNYDLANLFVTNKPRRGVGELECDPNCRW